MKHLIIALMLITSAHAAKPSRIVNDATSLLHHFASGYGPTTQILCGAVAPISEGIMVWRTQHRELTSREVHTMIASCLLGPLGPFLVSKLFRDLNPYRPQRNQAYVGHTVLGTDPDYFIRMQLHRTYKEGLYR